MQSRLPFVLTLFTNCLANVVSSGPSNSNVLSPFSFASFNDRTNARPIKLRVSHDSIKFSVACLHLNIFCLCSITLYFPTFGRFDHFVRTSH